MSRILKAAGYTGAALVGGTFLGTVLVGAMSDSPVLARNAATWVTRYCHVPQNSRLHLRAQINHATAPNVIHVECDVDAIRE